MKIACIGGGPAGLYFALLIKKARPEFEVDVYERNRPDDTFGWGVVFSDETLSHFRDADALSHDRIRESFIYWSDIDTFYGGECVRSTGHGFCGMYRKSLLQIMQERCRELGVGLHFEVEIEGIAQFADADLIVASDGINSRIREQHQEKFRPHLDWRFCQFVWLGTTKPLEAFTFIFKENEHGLYQVHAYPFQDGLSTWIVECHQDTWEKAGLDDASEEESVAYFQRLFEDDLDGHELLTNRSIWRRFPTVRNESWHFDNVVLLGDAAHTAHFSIGSGTKIAMEDAIALRDAVLEHGHRGVPTALEEYQEARWVEVAKLQKAAQTSLEWFENSRRYTEQDPLQFTFNLMTRSKRITWDNLTLRDPEFVERVGRWYAADQGCPVTADEPAPPPMFLPFKLRELELMNRVVVSPMCQYSATDGLVDDWHLVHLGSRAIGGAGLVITEMTDVSADARITPGCAGLYEPEHVAAWRRITEFVHQHSAAKIGIQLAHAGRKGSTKLAWEGIDQPLEEGGWEIIAPSPIPYLDGGPVPRPMNREDMDRVRHDFERATAMAEEAGFDLIELHMAHGYLLSSFISPLSNRRDDEYGGSLENRMRYPLEIFDAVRRLWPAERPLSVRISATDWVEEGGLTADDAVEIARKLKEHGCDVIDVSTGQTSTEGKPNYGRMYQVPFAERIRIEAGIPTMAVGAIQGADHCNTILAAGRADLCVMARPHLSNPYITLQASNDYGFEGHPWPNQYLAARRPK